MSDELPKRILPKYVAKSVDQFTGRVWLLPKLLHWWDESDDRMFLLTGGPGTGKSMILAWLAGFGPAPEDTVAGEQLERLRKMRKAAHFCQVAGRKTPQAFAESIVNQLTLSVDGFGDALAATLAERVQIIGTAQAETAESGTSLTGVAIRRINLAGLGGDEISFDKAFTRPLEKLYATGHTEPMLLLVDALDEAFGYTGDKTLPELLATLADLPAGVRLLVSTRPDPRVLSLFEGIEPFDLIKEAPPDVDDVRVYAAHRLVPSSALSAAQREAFTQRLATQAKGVFLYAAMVLDEVLPQLPEIPDLATYPLPAGLSGLYRRFLRRELGREQAGKAWPWVEIYEPLLGMLSVAQGEGLTAGQLTAIIGKDIRTALRASKQYLNGELPDGPFKPFHKSFADFLLEEEDNRDYHIDAPTMHARIAEYYWTKHSNDWSKCDDYGRDSLAVHLFRGRLFDRLHALISQEWKDARNEALGGSNQGFVADVELAWQADLLKEQDAERAIVKGVRCALIRTSFNSFSDAPRSLVARALEEGLLTPQVFLGWVCLLAAQKPAAKYIVDILTAALATGRLFAQDRERAESVAIEAAQMITDPMQRAYALTKLANVLEGTAKTRAVRACLDATKQIAHSGRRVDAVAELTPFLAEEEKNRVLQEALGWISEIRFSFVPTDDPSWGRANALIRLAPALSKDMALSSLAIADAIADPERRAAAKAALSPRLPLATQETVTRELLNELKHALEIARSQQTAHVHGSDRMQEAALGGTPSWGERTKILSPQVLVRLAPLLRPDEKERLFQDFLSLLALTDPGTTWSALIEIAPVLSPELTLLAVELGSSIKDRSARAELFAALSPKLSVEDSQRLLHEAAETLRDADPLERATGLAPWIRHADNEYKPILLREVIAAAQALSKQRRNLLVMVKLKSVLEAILSYLSEDDMEVVFGLVLLPSLGAFREELFELLAPKLKGEQLKHALAEVSKIEDQGSRSVAMGAIAQHMSGEAKSQTVAYALSTALEVGSSYQRIKTLAKFVDLLDDVEKEKVVSQALDLVTDASPFSALALETLAPHLTGKQINRGIEVARQLTDGISPSDSLVARGVAIMIPRLSGALKRKTIEEVLDRVGSSDHAHHWGGVLLRLVLCLDGEPLRRSWTEARKLDDGEDKAKVLLEIARRVSGQERNEALDESLSAAGGIPRPKDRVAMLIDIGKELPKQKRICVLEEARALASAVEDEYGDKGERAAAIAILPGAIEAEGNRSAFESAMDLARETAPWRQAELLEMLVPQLDSGLIDDAADMAEGIKDAEQRARALAAVAVKLVQEASDDHQKSEALRRIGDWLWSLKEIPRGQMLHFCTRALFEQKILSQHALDELADSIREIGDEWRFGLA